MSLATSLAEVTERLRRIKFLEQKIGRLKRLRLNPKDRRLLLNTERDLKEVKAEARELLSMLKRSIKK
jgi:hypothetical protein